MQLQVVPALPACLPFMIGVSSDAKPEQIAAVVMYMDVRRMSL